MSEERARPEIEALGFPFEDYLKETNSPGDYVIQHSNETVGLSRLISGSYEAKLGNPQGV